MAEKPSPTSYVDLLRANKAKNKPTPTKQPEPKNKAPRHTDTPGTAKSTAKRIETNKIQPKKPTAVSIAIEKKQPETHAQSQRTSQPSSSHSQTTPAKGRKKTSKTNLADRSTPPITRSTSKGKLTATREVEPETTPTTQTNQGSREGTTTPSPNLEEPSCPPNNPPSGARELSCNLEIPNTTKTPPAPPCPPNTPQSEEPTRPSDSDPPPTQTAPTPPIPPPQSESNQREDALLDPTPPRHMDVTEGRAQEQENPLYGLTTQAVTPMIDITYSWAAKPKPPPAQANQAVALPDEATALSTEIFNRNMTLLRANAAKFTESMLVLAKASHHFNVAESHLEADTIPAFYQIKVDTSKAYKADHRLQERVDLECRECSKRLLTINTEFYGHLVEVEKAEQARLQNMAMALRAEVGLLAFHQNELTLFWNDTIRVGIAAGRREVNNAQQRLAKATANVGQPQPPTPQGSTRSPALSFSPLLAPQPISHAQSTATLQSLQIAVEKLTSEMKQGNQGGGGKSKAPYRPWQQRGGPPYQRGRGRGRGRGGYTDRAST